MSSTHPTTTPIFPSSSSATSTSASASAALRHRQKIDDEILQHLRMMNGNPSLSSTTTTSTTTSSSLHDMIPPTAMQRHRSRFFSLVTRILRLFIQPWKELFFILSWILFLFSSLSLASSGAIGVLILTLYTMIRLTICLLLYLTILFFFRAHLFLTTVVDYLSAWCCHISSSTSSLTSSHGSLQSSHQIMREKAHKLLLSADNYQQWQSAARTLDKITQLEKWKVHEDHLQLAKENNNNNDNYTNSNRNSSSSTTTTTTTSTTDSDATSRTLAPHHSNTPHLNLNGSPPSTLSSLNLKRSPSHHCDFDCTLLLQTYHSLLTARQNGDVRTLMFLLQNIFHRKFCGLENADLYAHTHIGTKFIIEDFYSRTVEMLNFICTTEFPSFSTRQKLRYFQRARKSLGKTALCLSGGGALAMYHMGVCKALIQGKCLPQVINGTSGGSIVAGVLATRTDAELRDPNFLTETISNRYGVRWLPDLHTQVTNFVHKRVLMDHQVFAHTAKTYYGNYTFEEAYRRTGRDVSITVTYASRGSQKPHPMVLNHITSPHVLVWSAVTTSCALPGLMEAQTLKAKLHDGTITEYLPSGAEWVDGSLQADCPVQRLSELFNAQNYIVSQVNPHVVPFVRDDIDGLPQNNSKQKSSLFHSILYFCEKFLQADIAHRLQRLAKMKIIPKIYNQDFTYTFSSSQRYTGDITIVPRASFLMRLKALSHPTDDDMREYIRSGELATWPKISRIQNAQILEKTIEQCIRVLSKKLKAEERLAASQSNGSSTSFVGPSSANAPVFSNSSPAFGPTRPTAVRAVRSSREDSPSFGSTSTTGQTSPSPALNSHPYPTFPRGFSPLNSPFRTSTTPYLTFPLTPLQTPKTTPSLGPSNQPVQSSTQASPAPSPYTMGTPTPIQPSPLLTSHASMSTFVPPTDSISHTSTSSTSNSSSSSATVSAQSSPESEPAVLTNRTVLEWTAALSKDSENNKSQSRYSKFGAVRDHIDEIEEDHQELRDSRADSTDSALSLTDSLTLEEELEDRDETSLSHSRDEQDQHETIIDQTCQDSPQK